VSKQAGFGDNLYVAGFNLSGDTGSLGRIGGGPAALDVTGIDKSGYERIGGVREGAIEWSAWWNVATDAEHDALSTLPTSDILVTYCRGTSVGNPAAGCVAKQVNFDWSRAADGGLTGSVQALSNSYGLEWGQQLTAGVRNDTGAASGSSVDGGASSSFGLQAYLQVFSFTGTDATVKLQDSADNSTWADLTAGGFTQITAAPGWQRIATANNATIRRYLRAVVVTTGGFSALSYAVMAVRNATTVVF
jgi:hypothetical protein